MIKQYKSKSTGNYFLLINDMLYERNYNTWIRSTESSIIPYLENKEKYTLVSKYPEDTYLHKGTGILCRDDKYFIPNNIEMYPDIYMISYRYDLRGMGYVLQDRCSDNRSTRCNEAISGGFIWRSHPWLIGRRDKEVPSKKYREASTDELKTYISKVEVTRELIK